MPWIYINATKSLNAFEIQKKNILHFWKEITCAFVRFTHCASASQPIFPPIDTSLHTGHEHETGLLECPQECEYVQVFPKAIVNT